VILLSKTRARNFEFCSLYSEKRREYREINTKNRRQGHCASKHKAVGSRHSRLGVRRPGKPPENVHRGRRDRGEIGLCDLRRSVFW
jgi:hypothetical protein